MDFKKQLQHIEKEWAAGRGLADFEAILNSLVTVNDGRQLFGDLLSIDDPVLRQRLRQRVLDWRWHLMTPPAARSHPPRSAQFALLLIPKRNREHLVGDLEEEYRTIVLPQFGRFLARCWYFEQVTIAIGCYAWPTIKKILGLSVIFKLIGR